MLPTDDPGRASDSGPRTEARSEPAFERQPTLGEFDCLVVLGRGASGVVWKAFDRKLRRLVALKVLRAAAASSPEARARFRSEAEAGARLQHPNIVAVYGAGEADGELYIAEELVAGARTLGEWIDDARRSNRDPLEHFRAVATTIAALGDALEFAHAAGVIHRDVKPSNVLIDPHGAPKLADFGIAHLDDAGTLSHTGDIRGTPFYMSPEQADRSRGPIDARSDVYSLGATLFEALTLARPFDGGSAHDILRRVVSEAPQNPRRLRANTPRDLAAICLKALEKQPSARYASAREFADDLRRWLRNEPVVAREPGAVVRAVQWSRRRPTAAVALAAVVVVALVASVFAVRLRAEAERATRAAANAEAAATLAAQEAAQKQEALDLVVGLFRQTEPERAHGEDLTAAKMLSRAYDEIEVRFDQSPAVKSMLMVTLARACDKLGLNEIAVRLLARALELKRSTGESIDANELSLMASLGGALAKRRRFEEAHSMLAAALSELEQRAPDADMGLFAARTNLATERLMSGAIPTAEVLLRDALRRHEDALGPTSDEVLSTQYLLGAALNAQSQWTLARRELETVLERCERAGKSRGMLAVTARTVLGTVLINLGELECAERELDFAVDLAALLYAPEHPNRIIAVVNLADALSQLGRHAEALEHYEAALALRERLLSADAPSLLSVHSSVGLTLTRLGRYDEAEPHLRRVVSSSDEVGLNGVDVSSNARCNLALLCVETGRFEEAQSLARAEFTQRDAKLDADHPHRLFALEVLVRALGGLQRFAEAETFAEDLVASTRKTSPDRERRVQILRGLAQRSAAPVEAAAPRDK